MGPGSPSFVEDSVAKFVEVRDFLTKEVSEMSMPWKPLPARSGYFMMADISECKHLIPEKYFLTHDYEPKGPEPTNIKKVEMWMPGTNRVPADLAFARWMGIEKGVTMMPNCFFYRNGSKHVKENYVRLAICKKIDAVKGVCEKLRKIKI